MVGQVSAKERSSTLTDFLWTPGGGGSSNAWTMAAEGGDSDFDTVVTRWMEELTSRYPERLSHLVWDAERVRSLEMAVDQVVTADAMCPEHLRAFYRRSLINRITGLGPLDALLVDETVTEIMVNGPEVFVERQGRMERATAFADADDVADLARRIAHRAGRELNTENPLCDARLSDGSRIHCALPPISDRPSITIRRAPLRPLSLDDCLNAGAWNRELWEDLTRLVAERRNLIIAGGASSGKTSLLRLLAQTVGSDERLITIEDVRELQLVHDNVIRLETFRQFSLNRLVADALRMRPDRIIVGEVRGGEALDLVEAMASGHPGSLCTVHSGGGGNRTINRLARLALQRGSGLSFDSLREEIMDAVDIIVYMVRSADGRRRIDTVTAVQSGTFRMLWRWTGQDFTRGERP
jgi:pilus assembly protein CpaF